MPFKLPSEKEAFLLANKEAKAEGRWGVGQFFTFINRNCERKAVPVCTIAHGMVALGVPLPMIHMDTKGASVVMRRFGLTAPEVQRVVCLSDGSGRAPTNGKSMGEKFEAAMKYVMEEL